MRTVLLSGHIGIEAGHISLYFHNPDDIPADLETIMRTVLPPLPHPCGIECRPELRGPNAQGRIVIEQMSGTVNVNGIPKTISTTEELKMKLEELNQKLIKSGRRERMMDYFITLAGSNTKLVSVTQTIGFYTQAALGKYTGEGYKSDLREFSAQVIQMLLWQLTYPEAIISALFTPMLASLKAIFEGRGYTVR